MVNVVITSFGYKEGEFDPAGLPWLIRDVRYLPNPYSRSNLRPLTGKDRPVQNYVMAGHKGWTLLKQGIADVREKGASHLAFGCHGGRHRSVTMAEVLAEKLAEMGFTVEVRHRELRESRVIRPSKK